MSQPPPQPQPLLVSDAGADPRTRWFPVGRMMLLRALIAMTLYGALGTLVACALTGAAFSGQVAAAARPVLLGGGLLLAVLVVLLLRRMWRKAGDRHARLGVGPQGVWWCEQQLAFLFPWQSLAATTVLELRWRTAKSSYLTRYLELFPAAGAVPVHPVLDRLLLDGRYRLELPDARLGGGLIPLTESIARPLAETLAHQDPPRWRGVITRNATPGDQPH